MAAAQHRRVLLDSAAFCDSAEALSIDCAPTASIRTIAQRFLAACYDDVGKAPKYLEGEDIEAILRAHLPRRFGVRDPLADVAETVLEALLRFVHGQEVVTASFEQLTALGAHAAAFRAAVADGSGHADGRLVGRGETIQNRGDKVGRNDPCPCGSGKKFKKCCAAL